MTTNSIIDVHCHLFNMQYALKEVATITWNNIRGKYPHCKKSLVPEKLADKRDILDAVDGVAELIVYAANLIKATTQNCAANYETMCNQFKESGLGNGQSIISTPLMMDIYYALDNNESDRTDALSRRDADDTDFSDELLEINNDERGSFSEHVEKLKAMVQGHFDNEDDVVKRRIDPVLDSVFASVKEELLSEPTEKRGMNEYSGIEMSPGYRDHMKDLENLKEANFESVYPFLAVDPRRRGILKLIKAKVNTKEGPFHGVKIYPPLGYLPTHPALHEIFKYCEENQIPVTVHCSKGGVKNFKKKNWIISAGQPDEEKDFYKTGEDKSTFYANPKNWMPVLEERKNLKINFAHFGGSEQCTQLGNDKEWMNFLIGIMKNPQYPNVYTDLSYYTTPGLMSEIASLAQCQNIQDRIMFGTDYIMIMLDLKLGGLKNYYNNFCPVNAAFHYENAAKFLGV